MISIVTGGQFYNLYLCEGQLPIFDSHYHHYYYIIIFIITAIIIIVIVIAIIISSFSMFLTFSKVGNKDTETVSASLMGPLNSVYLIYS